ncbi:hypothetical protein Goari_025082 [Gossypium aridum]|uniref:Uncharacterized protein n=1 Tax=Gossypium aridum TaxID=34290 RepID=A0A7J8X823_GOSAI|nr:hypothetical protein [Gossypium aridum]
MKEQLKDTRAEYIVIIFYKPQYFMQNGPATQLGSFPSVWIHRTYFSEVNSNPYNYKDLQKYLCQINRIIPSDIWPPGDALAPWDLRIEPPTPYQEQLNKALEDYQSNIPDPKEWSQDYPWFCSNARENTPAWTDSQEKTSPMDVERNYNSSHDSLEQKLETKCYRAKEENAKKIEELNLTSDISTDYESD